MKSAITVFLTVMLAGAAVAQSYKPELDGKYLPAKIIFGDGVVRDIQMMYQQPEFFKNPLNKFKLANADGTGGYDHSGGIEAFLIDGNVWALRTVKGVQQFVILNGQGIIEKYEYIINGKVGNVNTGAYIVLGERSRKVWHNKRTNEMVEGEVSLEKLKEWIADAPDVVEDLKKEEEANALPNNSEPAKGLMGALQKASAKEDEIRNGSAGVDVHRIIHNYNATYENRNPGEVKLYFSPSMAWRNRAKTQGEINAEKSAAKAKVDALYANRSTTPKPEFASAKDNVPVKKETFAAKLNRIKTDGNKIGVVVKVNVAREVKPGEFVTPQQLAALEGFRPEELKEAGVELVAELNTLYNTSDFELIDLNNVPYRDVKVMGQTIKMDDWWASRYKVVCEYVFDPRLESSYADIGGEIKFVVNLQLVPSLVVTEYIGGPGSNKKDILAQVLTFGGFRTPGYAQTDAIKETREMYEKAISKLDVPILEKVKSERASEMPKVSKRLGP